MKIFFVAIFFCITSLMYAQSNKVLFAWEGKGLLSYRFNQLWSGNTGIGKRSLWTNPENSVMGQLVFLEIDQFITRKINPYIKASAGYKYRWINLAESRTGYEHRLTQQLALIHVKKRIRLVSRLRTEQRFGTFIFAHRYRYRFSADMPVSGDELNAKEFYLALANEILFEAVDDENDTWEDRISLNLGYLISLQMKAEIQFTLRFEDLTRSINQIPFVNTGLFFTLE